MRRWAILVLVGLLAPGCIEVELGTPQVSAGSPLSSPTSSPPAAIVSSPTPGPAPPQEPASKEAALTEAAAWLNVSLAEGQAPLNVSFTFDAAWPDGRRLLWYLDFEGDNATDRQGSGDDLPGNASHVFATPGNFTPTFRATDGTGWLNRTLPVNATPPPEPGLQTATGGWTAGIPECLHSPFMQSSGPEALLRSLGSGLLWDSFEVDAGTWGLPWRLQTAGNGAPVLLFFYEVDGGWIKTPQSSPSSVLEGTVPPGAVEAYVFPCQATSGTFSYTAGTPPA